MYRTLHEDLSRAAEAVRLRDGLRGQYEAMAKRYELERARHQALATELRKERKDVERLEGISFQRLFAMVGGELEERLGRERVEADEAELRFVGQDQLVAALRAERDALERRITQLGDVDAVYHEALEEKGRSLVERDDDHGKLVFSLAEQHSKACSTQRELREAIDCGNELARILADAAQKIDEAESFGKWDMLGGGLGVTLAKNGRLDDASRLINEAQAVFERFRKELFDIEGMTLHGVEEGEVGTGVKNAMVGFADYVLDGLLIDALIQRRITRFAADVATLRAEVHQRIVGLTEAEAANTKLRRARRKLLEEAIHAG